MLIDCDTCTVRGEGCADCVVTVLLGAPPGWQGSDPSVVTMRSPRAEEGPAASGHCGASSGVDSPMLTNQSSDVHHIDLDANGERVVVELDEVEHRAVRALADFGLVPPLRHQDASSPTRRMGPAGERHVS